MSQLLHDVRAFWFNNIPGEFVFDMVAGQKTVSRAAIHKYGGPAPDFNDCPICQKSEWASRLVQTNLFVPHSCKTSGACHSICEKQGNDKWTNWHQNFRFAESFTGTLDAPKCLFLLPEGIWKLYSRWYGHRCDFAWLNLKRQLAQACQLYVAPSIRLPFCNPQPDFLFMVVTGDNPWPGKRPDIPVVMMGWDFWHGKEKYQREIDLWQPDYFISSALCGWRHNLKFPKKTKFRYYHALPGSFFTGKPTVEKDIDLLVIGDVYNPQGLYEDRVRLNEQIEQLAGKYKVVFSHLRGGGRFVFEGPSEFTVDKQRFTTGVLAESRWPRGARVRLLNKWIDYIGRAKYVIFGPVNVDPKIMLRKHGEVLASGAVPIMPESPDLKYLKIEPMTHYIPLTKVWRVNGALDSLLGQHDKYKVVAQNAVGWHNENADRLIFSKFEDLVQEVTGKKHQRRLI